VPTPEQLSFVVALAALCAAAAVQTLTGAGFGLTAAPPLLVVAPTLVPDTLLWLTLAVTGYTAFVDRAHVDRGFVRRCTIAAIPGTLAGYAATALLSTTILGGAIAITVVAAGCAGLCGLRLPLTRATMHVAGFCSGAFNWTAALPGPPLALVYRSSDAATFRATLSMVFVWVSVLTLGLRYGTGAANFSDLSRAMALTIAVIAGTLLARPLTRRISVLQVTRATLVLSTASGVVLLVRALI